MSTASIKSVSYLQTLFAERYGRDLTDSELATYDSQAAVSGAIKTILADRDESGMIAPRSEDAAEVIELGIALGMQVVPGNTQLAVNRQLRTLRKSKRVRDYHKGASSFNDFLATLKPEADEAEAGF